MGGGTFIELRISLMEQKEKSKTNVTEPFSYVFRIFRLLRANHLTFYR